VADSKALLHRASGSINNASSSSVLRATRKSQFEELQASLADKLAAVHARQQSLDMENKFIYDDIVDV
jgi:hypothetical protein